MNNLLNFFSEESEKSIKTLGFLNKTQVQHFEWVISEISQCLPELTLMGSWPLRLEMKERGLGIVGVPYEYDYLDLDYFTDSATFYKLRNALPIEIDNDFMSAYGQFNKDRVKKIINCLERKERDIIDADKLLYLEKKSDTKKRRRHIEIFNKNDFKPYTKTFTINNSKVCSVTIEEVFVGRFKKIIKLLSESGKQINFPSKNWHYLALNGGLVDSEKVKKIWQRENLDGFWEDEIDNLIKKIQLGLKNKRIIFIDKVA